VLRYCKLLYCTALLYLGKLALMQQLNGLPPYGDFEKKAIILKVRGVGRETIYNVMFHGGSWVRLGTEVMTNCLAALPVAIYLSAAPKGIYQ
jgi:hypothetical protein